MADDDVAVQLPRWVSHKRVYADRIKEIHRETSVLAGLWWTLECGGRIKIGPSLIARGEPTVGDYYIRYDDGYESWSPAKAFKEGYTRDGTHQGLPISGYRPQSDAAVAAVNLNKEIEERLLRRLEELKPLLDPRWASVAKTHFEEGFMALNRAVFKPERVKLEA